MVRTKNKNNRSEKRNPYKMRNRKELNSSQSELCLLPDLRLRVFEILREAEFRP